MFIYIIGKSILKRDEPISSHEETMMKAVFNRAAPYKKDEMLHARPASSRNLDC